MSFTPNNVGALDRAARVGLGMLLLACGNGQHRALGLCGRDSAADRRGRHLPALFALRLQHLRASPLLKLSERARCA